MPLIPSEKLFWVVVAFAILAVAAVIGEVVEYVQTRRLAAEFAKFVNGRVKEVDELRPVKLLNPFADPIPSPKKDLSKN